MMTPPQYSPSCCGLVPLDLSLKDPSAWQAANALFVLGNLGG